MIIFLYGPDDYRREEKKKYWVAEFEKKYSGLSIGHFDLIEAEALDEFRGFTRSQSIFEDKKLAVLENTYEMDEKQLAQVLAPLVNEKTTTILFSEKEAPNKALNFLLKKPATTEKFEYLKGQEWKDFVNRAARKLKISLSPEALLFLANVYQNNTWGFVTELEKIRDLKPTAIERRDLENLGLDVLPDFWSTMNGLKNQELAQRLTTLEKIFARNEPPPKIFNILSSLWREKIPQMAEYDLKIKSGKLDYEEALVDLVLSQEFGKSGF